MSDNFNDRDRCKAYENLKGRYPEIRQKIEYDLDYEKSTLEEKGRMLLTFIWYVQDTIQTTSVEEIIDRAEFIKSLYKFGRFQRKKFYTEFSDQTYRFEFYKIIKAIEKEEELDSKAKALLICLIEKHHDDNKNLLDEVLDRIEKKRKLTKEQKLNSESIIEKSLSVSSFDRYDLINILRQDDYYNAMNRWEEIYEILKKYKNDSSASCKNLIKKIEIQNPLDEVVGKEATDIVKRYYTYSDTIHRKIPIELQNVNSILSNMQAAQYSRAELENEVQMLTCCCITDGCEISLSKDNTEQVKNYKKLIKNYKKLIEKYKKNVMNNMVTLLFGKKCSDNNQLLSWTGNKDLLNIAAIFDEMYNQIETLINRESARKETYEKLNKIVDGKYKVVDRYDEFMKITGELLYEKNIFKHNKKNKLQINNLNLAGLIYFVLRMVKYESIKKYENIYSKNLDIAENLKHDREAILLSTIIWMHNFNYFVGFKSIDFFVEGKFKEESLNISSKIVKVLIRDIDRSYNRIIRNNERRWQEPWEKQRKYYKELSENSLKSLNESNWPSQDGLKALERARGKKDVIGVKVRNCCLKINEYIDYVENLDGWVRNAYELLDAKIKLDKVKDNFIENYKCLLASKDKEEVIRSIENIKEIHKKFDKILKMIDEM